MWRGISLANKCLLLFGAAVILIIVAALSVPWLRMNSIVDEAQLDTSRQLVLAWESLTRSPGGLRGDAVKDLADGHLMDLTLAQATERGASDEFVRAALARLADSADRNEYVSTDWEGTTRRYLYAKAVRDEDHSLRGLIVLDRAPRGAAAQLLVNTAYLFSAGLIAGGVAVLVFYLITSRLILSPVRQLKDTAELVREGNLATRSQIYTGDEFEDLSDTFNQMVEALTTSQEQLRAINNALDLKLNELAERNVALHESNRLKGEFLANVSHELRTPLNSIIGFTELLLEVAEREAAAGDDSTRLAKRRRYLDNIMTSGRSLLDMITGLLEMAKIEAGKMELVVEPMNLRDACEGLLALMRPLADRGGVELVLDVQPDLPMIETDVKKFQQIIFNLLSNAVKFTSADPVQAAGAPAPAGAPTEPDQNGQPAPLAPAPSAPPRPARVTLRAERLVGRGSEGAAAEDRIRVSVLDTGPGIAAEDLPIIFEKFRQLDSGHTRKHTGTGLGLAISKDLTGILQGEIQVHSEPGQGSMFSVILPLRLDPQRAGEMRLEMAFRGALAAQRK